MMTTKLLFSIIIAICMVIPASAIAQTTEDDGYIIGDDDSAGEVSSQEELEETYEDTPWEDNVGPNDFEEAQERDEAREEEQDSTNDACEDAGTQDGESGKAFSKDEYRDCPTDPETGDNPYLTGFIDGCNKQSGVDDEYCQLETDRSSVWGENPPTKQSHLENDANPYCDKFANGPPAGVSCHDRKDYSDTSGLYTCNDGTTKTDWRDCKDASNYNYNNDDNNSGGSSTSTSTTTTALSNCTTWSYDLDIKLAGLNATSAIVDRMYDTAAPGADGGDKYNAEVDKYDAEVAIINAEIDRYNAECAGVVTNFHDNVVVLDVPIPTPPSNNNNGRPCEKGFVNVGTNLDIICERIQECNVPFYMTCDVKK
jgi:hypothetical protein